METHTADRLGSYALGPMIGRGAMGVVYSATPLYGSSPNPEPVAVKILRDELSTDEVTVGRFLREKRILKSADHPNVVAVYDLVAEGDRVGLVMELVDGGDLKSLISGGGLGPAEAIDIATQIADGLTHIHDLGVAHCDLKPANVLLGNEGARRTVKISDFGVSRLIEDAVRQPTLTIGTPRYMAPEAADRRLAGPPSDVYALGVVLFEMLVGEPPFSGHAAAALVVAHSHRPAPVLIGVPTELSTLVGSMLSKDAAARPSAAEVRLRLAALAPLVDDSMTPSASAAPGVDDTTVFTTARTIERPKTWLPAETQKVGVGMGPSTRSFIDRLMRNWQLLMGGAVAAILTVALFASFRDGPESLAADLPPGQTEVLSPSTSFVTDSTMAGSVGGPGEVTASTARFSTSSTSPKSTASTASLVATTTSSMPASTTTAAVPSTTAATTTTTVATTTTTATSTTTTTTTSAPTTTTITSTTVTAPSTAPSTTTTTVPVGEPVAIVSGPNVVSVGRTSAVFTYTTNDVCGTGSFTYREQSTGEVIGRWIGDDGCFGPVHYGRTEWPGITLEPGTTYQVSIVLDGKPGNGVLATGIGRTTTSIIITTSP